MPRTQSLPAVDPAPFAPHPSLGDEINENICLSEIEGGVFLKDVPVGVVLEIETKNRLYRLENRGDGKALISGHPEHCPDPVLVKVHGSTWGKSMIKMQFIGLGMHLEYRHPRLGVVRTSRIQAIRQPITAAERVSQRPA
ncbi:MAG TPA: hypothetical protein VEU62_07005 [Bryobacterales bacterium]|nr:hypothetical protein [Bryobacterales bacterium]